MTHDTPLDLLLERAQAERDEVLAHLQQLVRQAAAAQAQAEQLLAYRSEYERRWRSQFAQNGAIQIVQCYQGFMGRLEQAVAQQERIAQHVQTQREAARAALAERELRLASVRKLIERRALEQQRAADRREQKQTDEAAQRASWHGPAARLSPLAG